MLSLPLSCFVSNTPSAATSNSWLRTKVIVKPSHAKQTHRFEVSCDATNGAKNQKEDFQQNVGIPQGKFDRRNVLLGMGGLYGAANLVSADSPVFAEPIAAPDFKTCSIGTDLNTQKPLDVDCCPPITADIVDYKLPPFLVKRFRPAAHLVTKEYVKKYEKAVALMKALPAEDPRNFYQQANVHCAYCNLTYEQNDNPNLKLQIHNCWHFFPWHRWYLYFYERILGKLIDDPTFGLPFWNWDTPDGMVMPDMYTKKESSLYNENRNPNHYPPALADLAYSRTNPTDPSNIVNNNLNIMYNEMVSNVPKFEDFYGEKYVVGTAPDPGPGSVERGSHNALHSWVGTDTIEGLDMGNFYSTGKESLFFCHHANIDRMWTISRDLRKATNQPDIFDPDWLNAEYLFYDENKKLCRVKNADTLENEKMGYIYQLVDLPWLKRRPTAKVKKSKIATTSGAPDATTVFPVKLDKTVKVLVNRPKKSRGKKDKEKEQEYLLIEGIEVDTATLVRFEVFINDEDEKTDDLDKAEYAGCFSQVPHKISSISKVKIRLALNNLLEDLDVEGDDKILVSLVPKDGGEVTTIGGIKIIYA